jgi:hypothetical protein
MHHVRDDLGAVGLRVWTDEGFEPGSDDWRESVDVALRNAGCVVAILSPDSAHSRWIRQQLDFADALGKQVFMILAKGDPGELIPAEYPSHHWIDIRQKTSHDAHMRQLIQTIRQHVEEETRTLPTPPNLTTGSHRSVSAENGRPVRKRSAGRLLLMLILMFIVILIALALVWLFALGGLSVLTGALNSAVG